VSRHAHRLSVLVHALVAACAGWVTLFGVVPAAAGADGRNEAAIATLDELGQALFHDVNLSRTRTQSCASCHDPARAFSEPVAGRAGGAVSTSADGLLLGDRNAPPLTYAALVPPLHRDAEGNPAGGLFHDGRANDLAEQAVQPILNATEMQMPDAAAVLTRVREQPRYVRAFRDLLGVDLLAVDAAGATGPAFTAIGQALAAFQRTPAFIAFDSRYDRSLRGELELTDAETKGRDLFFSALTNCSRCHLLDTVQRSVSEPFTSHRYFNVGTPPNHAVRAINGHPPGAIDAGLAANPAMASPAFAGMFRVPSLRNVAVTGPYMHNGVFRELSTVVFFYNQYQGRSAAFGVNPETGEAWHAPEVPETVDVSRLREGQPMEADRIALIVAFLRALTDRRYEHLLAE
jgi:cytochrome c peroxidase